LTKSSEKYGRHPLFRSRASKVRQAARLRLRPLWLVIGWAMVAAVVWATLTPKPPQPAFSFFAMDKVEHLLAYAVLMGWFMQLHRGRTRLAYGLGLAAMGVLLEVLQGLGGVRYFEYADMAANATGVALAALLGRTACDRILLGLERRLFP